MVRVVPLVIIYTSGEDSERGLRALLGAAAAVAARGGGALPPLVVCCKLWVYRWEAEAVVREGAFRSLQGHVAFESKDSWALGR